MVLVGWFRGSGGVVPWFWWGGSVVLVGWFRGSGGMVPWFWWGGSVVEHTPQVRALLDNFFCFVLKS